MPLIHISSKFCPLGDFTQQHSAYADAEKGAEYIERQIAPQPRNRTFLQCVSSLYRQDAKHASGVFGGIISKPAFQPVPKLMKSCRNGLPLIVCVGLTTAPTSILKFKLHSRAQKKPSFPRLSRKIVTILCD